MYFDSRTANHTKVNVCRILKQKSMISVTRSSFSVVPFELTNQFGTEYSTVVHQLPVQM